MKRKPTLLQRWVLWTQRSETGFLLLLAVAVGILAGLTTTLYRLALLYSYRFFFTHSHTGFSSMSNVLLRAGLPILGGLIVGYSVYRLMHLRGGHGVPSVIKAVVTGHLTLPPSMAAKSGLSVITMASGGSAGPEGPIVEIGAVLGSTVGRLARATREQIGTLVGCGAASGIAAIFNAPLGGVFFALELILREFTITRFSPVVLAAVIASVTTQILLPGEPAFEIPRQVVETIVPNFALIAAFALLGPLCALFSALYISSLYRAQDFFQHSVRLPTWLKPAFGGLLVGLVALFMPGIQSEGYEFLNARVFEGLLNEVTLSLILVFFLYALVKVLATALTLGSGFVGGSFAPALFIGGTLGASFGILASFFFPESLPSPVVFALVGMAGVVGGSLGAPISALLIVYEITGGQYQILLPLLITVATAAALTRRMRSGSVYTLSLLRDGFDVEAATQQRDPLAGLTARDAMATDVPTLPADTTLSTILDLLAESEAPAFCVTDSKGRFQGLISINDLRAVLSLGEDMGPLLLAAEIADPHPQWLGPARPLSEALSIFSRSDVEAIPILDPERPDRVLGVIFRRHLFGIYRQKRLADDSDEETLPGHRKSGGRFPAKKKQRHGRIASVFRTRKRP